MFCEQQLFSGEVTTLRLTSGRVLLLERDGQDFLIFSEAVRKDVLCFSKWISVSLQF